MLETALVFRFDLFLEARAEILEKKSLVFWKICRHQKHILKLTDLYYRDRSTIASLGGKEDLNEFWASFGWLI